MQSSSIKNVQHSVRGELNNSPNSSQVIYVEREEQCGEQRPRELNEKVIINCVYMIFVKCKKRNSFLAWFNFATVRFVTVNLSEITRNATDCRFQNLQGKTPNEPLPSKFSLSCLGCFPHNQTIFQRSLNCATPEAGAI
jgi:hypothetical protein